MDTVYRNCLSADIQKLVDEIEATVDFEIAIEVRAQEDEAHRQGSRPLKCEVDQHGARIITPAADHFPESSVLHELLHIRRFLIEKVPRLIFCEGYDPWSYEFESALTSLDNSIEHLIIVPHELTRMPERKSYWVEVMRRALNDLRTDRLSIDDRERLVLQNAVFVTTVLNDPKLAADFNALVEQFGISARANAILDAVHSVLHSKEQIAKAFVTQLRIPSGPVCLEYIDATTRTSREINISQIG